MAIGPFPGGADGFTEAASNSSFPAADCPKAAPHIKIPITKRMKKVSLALKYDEPAREALRHTRGFAF
jgi:hypothetical protein